MSNHVHLLIELVHHRWSVPLLAELHQLSGAKYVTLVKRLQLSKDSLTRTLTFLIDAGWVVRNPGYGHPMRPEYVLTSNGKRIGPACLALVQVIALQSAADVAWRKWTLPVVMGLCEGSLKFSELKPLLPGITPRALTNTLKALIDVQWLWAVSIEDRKRPGYGLTVQGKKLCPYLCALLKHLIDISYSE